MLQTKRSLMRPYNLQIYKRVNTRISIHTMIQKSVGHYFAQFKNILRFFQWCSKHNTHIRAKYEIFVIFQ